MIPIRVGITRIVQQPLCFLIGCRILNPVRVECPIRVDIRQIREPAMDGRIWILCRIPAIEDKTLTDNKRNLPAIGIEAVTALNGSSTREGRRCKLTAIGLELDIVLPSQRIIEVDKDRPSRCLLLIPDKVLNIEIEVTRNTSFRIRSSIAAQPASKGAEDGFGPTEARRILRLCQKHRHRDIREIPSRNCRFLCSVDAGR